MSRRKQSNPNKVKLMDSSAEEKKTGEEVSSAMGTTEVEQMEETDQHTESQPAVSVTDTQIRVEAGKEGPDGADLSSITSMMSTVMKAAQLNGGVEVSNKPPTKTSSKNPSSNRYARKSQDAKDDTSSFICPLCDKNCQTQHQFTMHIRQHNSDTGASEHSCSICGKCLSSASSLDRHMLVHSGERPYKCSVCSQTFTTNGNMHRHMKIHTKDPSLSTPTSPSSSGKRKRPTAVISKKKSSQSDDGEQAEELANKKQVLEEGGGDGEMVSKGQEELLPCPICFKALGSKHELETHMETHPDTALRCEHCCLSFRTHRGLLRHNAVIHKQLPTDPSGRPFIQNNPSIPPGFNDLAFIDFSCHKFPHIAQVWCETNLRRCTSKLHRFVCETCDKAFPLNMALDLHKSTHDTSQTKEEAASSQLSDTEPHMSEKTGFMSALGLQHSSQDKPAPSKENVMQAGLDSIRVIHAESSAQPESNFLGGISLSLVDPSSLRGLSQHDALKVLSLQPFQTGFLVQPDVGMIVKPICGENGIELADIQQILKVAASAPNQISLPPLSKAPCSAVQSNYKQMPPLKPKPLGAPRTNISTSTPPPLLTTQQASLGCISPSLPPPAGQFPKSAKELSPSSSSSSSSSSTCNQSSGEKFQMEADCMGNAHTPMDTDDQQLKQAEDKIREPSGKKGASRKGSYQCRHCHQLFAYSGVFHAHMRYHTGSTSQQCNICDYAAPDKATLTRHMRTHSGERPYICRVCLYPFTVKANCERHLRKKHMKNTRKDIEKNVKYVSSSTSMPNALEPTGLGDTVCRLCDEDLKTYRALEIHMRVHNGFQRKPFECKCCGAAFLAKRNCIHHLLKQHPEIKEQGIDEHITTITVATKISPKPLPLNGVPPCASMSPIKVEDLSFYSTVQEQPLDFSNKKWGVNNPSPKIKMESATYDSMEPIDLSIPKNPDKKMKVNTDVILQREVKKEQTSLNIMDHTLAPSPRADRTFEEKPQQFACYQLPTALTTISASSVASRGLRLKPLLPKPNSAVIKELPPLASIAQIISSVSGAPDLLKRDGPNGCPDSVSEISAEELLQEGSKSKRNKRCKEKPAMNSTDSNIDLESSGEFASVEKMLATSNANKFSTFLKSNIMELERKEGEQSCNGVKNEVKEGKQMQAKQISQLQQPKGKKNAYSNSVQKMTCPFCPRVFPWASSLQRHMLTHTGHKPFPCSECDALFSTKSNCERHLLRKHGLTSRILRQNGSIPKAKGAEECSPESAESMSETELANGDAMDLTNPGAEMPAALDAEEPSPAKPTEAAVVTPLLQQEEPEPQDVHGLLRRNMVNDEDTHSEKSLDLNFASKLIDFTFSEGEQQRSSPAVDSESHEQEESKLTCKICNKSFRFTATLARHEKVHVLESAADEIDVDSKADDEAEASEVKKHNIENEVEKVERNGTAESEGTGSGMESGSEEDKEERSDEEGAAAEPKSCEGAPESSGSKTDKRKKICAVCSKRFWSLQDLTRHMRSHTGERPYKCQTCERTFTLKHSLVRHQRIHQKSRGTDEEMGRAADEEGFSGGSASERETTPSSTNPTSENESESTKEKECKSASETNGEPQFNKETVSAAETPKEPRAEEPASDSPTEVEQPAGFLQGLLEVHSKPDIEHIVPSSEPPLLGVE